MYNLGIAAMKRHIGHPKLTGVSFALSEYPAKYVQYIDFYVQYGYTLKKEMKIWQRFPQRFQSMPM